MGRNGNHSLKRFVYRTLVIRLIVAGLFIAAVLGLTVLLVERNRVAEEVITHATRGTRLFNAQNIELFSHPGLPDHNAIQQELISFASSYEKLKTGHFVYLRLYNRDLTTVAELIDKEYHQITNVAALMERDEHRAPVGDTSYDLLRIEGKPHLKTFTLLKNTRGEVVAYAKGIFAPSEQTIGDIRRRAVRSMLVVIAIVLITTALLYPVILNLTRKLTAFSVKLLDSNLSTLETLGSAIAKRDSDTNAHNYRVTIYSVRIAEAVRLPARTIQTLIKGAFLHDVGKIGIKDSILLKPGRLDKEEFNEMKKHVSFGHDIVNRSEWLQDALEVVNYHHEKMCGEGYLKNISGEDIPITARIFAIADVFDALTSQRPYKDPWPFEKAMSILEEDRGTHFDPDILDAFSRIARPLYDRFAGSDNVPEKELKEIMYKYFTEGIESLAY